jgi:hypothetical protein
MADSERTAVRVPDNGEGGGDILLELDDDLFEASVHVGGAVSTDGGGEAVVAAVGEDKDAKGTVVTPPC